LPQQHNHAQLSKQHGIKGNLVEAIENLQGGLRDTWRSTGLICMRIVWRDLHSRTNGAMVGLPDRAKDSFHHVW
jgi:hypothetical protein